MGPTGAPAGVRASPLLQDAGLNGREPPEKEKGRRRLKESFENYRRWARAGGGWGCGRGPRASPRPPALSGSPAGSGPSGRFSSARGRGRRTERTPRAATTPTLRAPSRPTVQPSPSRERGAPPPHQAAPSSASTGGFCAGTLKCNFVNKLPRSGRGRLQWSRSSTRRRSPGGSRAHRRPPGGSRTYPPTGAGSRGGSLPPLPASKMAAGRGDRRAVCCGRR